MAYICAQVAYICAHVAYICAQMRARLPIPDEQLLIAAICWAGWRSDNVHRSQMNSSQSDQQTSSSTTSTTFSSSSPSSPSSSLLSLPNWHVIVRGSCSYNSSRPLTSVQLSGRPDSAAAQEAARNLPTHASWQTMRLPYRWRNSATVRILQQPKAPSALCLPT